MSYACKNCGTVIMEDDKDLCPECLCINVGPLPERPVEPCCTSEAPETWASIADWESARADRAEADRDRWKALAVEAGARIDLRIKRYGDTDEDGNLLPPENQCLSIQLDMGILAKIRKQEVGE